jgi:predicted permease
MLRAFGRMKDGISLSKAQADLDLVSNRLEQEYPDYYPAARGHRTVATSLQEEMTVNFRATLFVLLGTAGFVLLIVCASVANLMLARLVRREREMAVRSAVGATRGRLLRQLLTESTLLAVLGGLVGLAIAGWSVDLLVAFALQFTPRASEISLDRSVLLYTLAVSVATGLVVGAVPAFSSKLTDASSLREGARATQSRHATRSALIVVQVAASFMLLIGAGLTIRSLLKLQQVDPGIDTENILTMRIDVNFTKYPSPPVSIRAELWERIEEEIRNRPGVTRVGGAATFPLNEQGPFSGSFAISGRELATNETEPTVDVRVATPDYFATVGQAVVSGRAFRRSDRIGQPPVVIVNQTMARHYWPGASPLGARISGNDGRTWLTVVGVVADTRQQLNENFKDEVYVPMFQSAQLSTMWLVRSNVEPETMAREIRAAVRSVDPEQPVDNFRTLADVRSASIAPRKLTATLLGLFGLLALVITATGIAGVIAFSVNQRTQEFGVMMALGAPRVNVLAMVLRQGLQLVLIGLAIGLAGALVLTRMLSTMLFGIEPTDGITFVAVSMVLIAVAALACLVPAKRAASVDPMIALRAV